MRISQIIGPGAIRDLVNALSNRLHARDNFAPDGTKGQVLTSNGSAAPPSFQDIQEGISKTIEEGASSGAGWVDSLIGPQGSIGLTGPGGPMIPTFIAAGTAFKVPVNMQALYAMTIDNEGILDVEGYLILVD